MLLRRRHRMCALLLLGTIGASGVSQSVPAAAEQGPHPLSVRTTAAQLFELAEVVQKRGDSKKAIAILNVLEADPRSDVRNEARYRHAMIIEADGRVREAAVLLRRVLNEKPDASAVRLKLADMLQKMGDEVSALRELRALRTTDLPPTVARFVDRVSASLQARKPFGLQVEIALAPDSNINRATRSDTLGTIFGDFTLNDEAKAKSGVGAAIRGMAHTRKALTDGLSFVARASGEARLYRDREWNDMSLDLSMGPEFQLGKTRFTTELGVVRQWYGMKPYQFGARLAGSATRAVGPTSQIRLDAGYRTINNQLNDLLDGHAVYLRGRYERALSTQMLIATSVSLERQKASDSAYSTRSSGGGITIYRDIGRMTLSAGLDAGLLVADERLTLLPRARKDHLIRLHLGSTFRQLTVSGFAPMMRIIVERNRSTVEYYDYQRTRTEFGVVRAF